jgi:hypothetical protein
LATGNPVSGDPGTTEGTEPLDWPVMGFIVPGVLLEGVKNTVGTGEIEILGLGVVGLTVGIRGMSVAGKVGVGLLATG